MEGIPSLPQLCDILIRQMRNVQRYTVQCVLPINLFNEKIFIFLWFWLFLVAVLTFFNFFAWIFYCVFQDNKARYVKKYLKITHELQTGLDKKLARKFVCDYLRDDGVFVLRVIGKNSSDMVLTDLVVNLWKLFKESYATYKKTDLPLGNGDGDAEFTVLHDSITKENYV